jgi:hypothetical protein
MLDRPNEINSERKLMLRISRTFRVAFLLAPLLLFAGIASAQSCPDNDATPPETPLAYPLPSDQYSVQYQIDGRGWTPAMVFISYYGQTTGSPQRDGVPYVTGPTSMSFVSIPAYANAVVQLRVTKLATGPFQFSDNATVRPTPILANVQTQRDGTVEISTRTAGNFNGEQFILMWNHGTDGGSLEGLAFYLNPPYTRPTGTNAKVVTSWTDLQGFANDPNLLNYNTIDFESSSSALLPVPIQLGGDGSRAYKVPANIQNVFFGPSAWVRGKLQFNKITPTTYIYGPGVLDGSQFSYLNRDCVDHAGNPTVDGLYSLSSLDQFGKLTNFNVNGIIISDINHAADDPFYSSVINNVKVLGWNSNNAALRLDDSTTASNIFIRSSDDSMMIWGSPVTVTNATVWQGYNGGVISLGWSDNSIGDGNMVDGLWVVKTDWVTPTVQSWDALSQPGPPKPVNGQNDGVIASLMIPSTSYGKNNPPVFRNIYVEDTPQVLFSIKIVPPVNCTPDTCLASFLTQNSSLVQLKIENLFSPQSVIKNSIGFQTIPKGFIANATDTVSYFPADYTLAGTMNIELTNVWIKLPFGLALPLTDSFTADWLGKITTNGNVHVKYSLGPPLFW